MARFIPSFKKRKQRYDQLLKELENNPDSFRNDYPVYFKTKKAAHIDNMSIDDFNAFDSGAGSELKEHITKQGKNVPPSMLSVASSSRFCYLSLKDCNFNAFNIERTNFVRRFEEKLPIFDKGIPPHMDAYYEAEKEVCFFECKCHEQFDRHYIRLAESYFNKGLIVDLIFKDYPYQVIEKTNRKGIISKYRQYPSSIFGVSNNPRFDIKQLITHIMGINERMKDNKDKKARLIYFYFMPNETLVNKNIKEVYELLIEEAQIIFKFISGYATNISFELYIQHSDTVETSTKDNVKRII